MRQWKLHHGLPSFNLDGSQAQPSRHRRESSTAESKVHPIELGLFTADQDAGDNSDVVQQSDVCTRLAKAPPIQKSRLHGRVDPTARQGDDRAADVTVGVLLPSAMMVRCDDIPLTKLSTIGDCQPGDIVMYRVGQDDPVHIIAESLARGASAILSEQLLPCPLPQAVVGDVELAATTIRRHQLGCPDQRLLTIGVVGNAGKTTTALWVANVTREMGLATAYETSLGSNDSSQSVVEDQAIKGGAEMIDRLNKAAEQAAAVAVIEIDDQAATHGRYDAIEFDVLLCCGGLPTKQDFGPSALVAVLDRVVADGVAIAPSRDVAMISAIEQSGIEMVTYGTDDADLTYDIIDDRDGLMTVMLTTGDTMHVAETNITGSFNAANLAAAACIGRLFDRPLHSIAESISRVRTIPGRVQRFADVSHATMVLDSASTPTSVRELLRSESNGCTGKIWVVLAVDGDDQRYSGIGSMIEQHSAKRILTSGGEKATFLSAAHQVIDGVQKCIDCRLICDPTKAVEFALEHAAPTDTIVVLCGRGGQTQSAVRQHADQWTQRLKRASRHVELDQDRPSLKIFSGE